MDDRRLVIHTGSGLFINIFSEKSLTIYKYNLVYFYTEHAFISRWVELLEVSVHILHLEVPAGERNIDEDYTVPTRGEN